MATMKAVQISKANGPFEVVERDIPEPGPGEVRIKVEACGICHSDAFVKSGAFPGIVLPRIPGHEIAGRVDAVGRQRRLVEEGRSRRRRLARRSLLRVQRVPQGALHQLREGADHRHQLRRRLRRVRGRSARRRGAHSGQARRGRRGPAALRGRHHLQRAPQQRRAPGRHRRGAGHRRARPPRDPVRGAHGLPHGRRLARLGQGGARATARRPRVRRHEEGEGGGGPAEARRRRSRARHRAVRRRDREHGRRAQAARQAPHRRGAVRAAPGLGVLAAQRQDRRGLAERQRIDSEETMAFSALTDVRPRIEKFKLDQAEEAFAQGHGKQGPLPRGAHAQPERGAHGLDRAGDAARRSAVSWALEQSAIDGIRCVSPGEEPSRSAAMTSPM